jgi:hypothetical protein
VKKHISALILFALLSIAAVSQTASYTSRAHVPFPFVVRNDVMPAGDYLVQMPPATPGPLMLLQVSGKKGEIVLQVPVQEKWSGRPQLLFQKLAGVYFLVEVSDPRVGVQRVQQGERYLVAKKAGSTETVVVAAK